MRAPVGRARLAERQASEEGRGGAQAEAVPEVQVGVVGDRAEQVSSRLPVENVCG